MLIAAPVGLVMTRASINSADLHADARDRVEGLESLLSLDGAGYGVAIHPQLLVSGTNQRGEYGGYARAFLHSG